MQLFFCCPRVSRYVREGLISSCRLIRSSRSNSPIRAVCSVERVRRARSAPLYPLPLYSMPLSHAPYNAPRTPYTAFSFCPSFLPAQHFRAPLRVLCASPRRHIREGSLRNWRVTAKKSGKFSKKFQKILKKFPEKNLRKSPKSRKSLKSPELLKSRKQKRRPKSMDGESCSVL